MEIQSEAVDKVNLADSSSSIGQPFGFLERVKKDERTFEILLGVDCPTFGILLEEVHIPHSHLSLSGIELVLPNDPALDLGVPINDAAISNLPSPPTNHYQIPEKNG